MQRPDKSTDNDGHADDGHAPVAEPSVEEVEQPVHRNAQEYEPAVCHDIADGGIGKIQVTQVGVEFGTGVNIVGERLDFIGGHGQIGDSHGHGDAGHQGVAFMRQRKFLAGGVHGGPPGLVLGKKDGGVILAHDAGISQVLERAFQDAGLGTAEKAACEIGRHFLFQGAVCMVKEMGVGIFWFAFGDRIGAPAEDAHVAQILDIGRFIEQGDGQANEIFAAGQYFTFQIFDGVQGVRF